MSTQKQLSFKQQHSFEKRAAEGAKIRARYPDRIPLIVERAANAQIPAIDKKKYLAPADLTMGQFIFVIRKRCKLPADQAIYVFINGILPAGSMLLSQVYEQYADKDQFLYLVYTSESSFGSQ